MAAATVNEVFVGTTSNVEWHDVTFAATGDTYDCGVNVKAYTYGVRSWTGSNANGVVLGLTGNTFTLSLTGTPNTAVRMWIQILKKR